MTTPIQNVSNVVSSTLVTQTIFFANHRKAQTVEITEETQNIALIFETLKLSSSNALINLAGSQSIEIEGEMNGRMAQLFSRGIAAVAADLGATLIDNGISSKINKLLGKGVADRSYKSPLIGVCESALAHQEEQLESNHSHFIFIDNNQLNYIDIFNKIIDYFSIQSPVLTILVGGDELACEQVLHSVRQGFPVIIVNKTGGLADELTNLKQNPPEFISNPMHAEIISDGKLYLFESDGILDKKIGELQRLIRRLLRGDTTLRQAWERFAAYDLNASRHQKNFRNIQLAVLFLTVLGTGLALVQNSLDRHITLKDLYLQQIAEYDLYKKQQEQKEREKQEREQQEKDKNKIKEKDQKTAEANLSQDKAVSPQQPAIEQKNNITSEKSPKASILIEIKNKNSPNGFKIFLKWLFIKTYFIFEFVNELMRSLIIFIPIMITALLAAANRFNAGSKWLLLRGSAQSVMREIFKYRARSDYYFSNEKGQPSREERLAERLKDINNGLLQSDISTSSLQPFKDSLPPLNCIAKNDDGISRLSPEQYLSYRLEDQYNYYVKKTTQLEKKFKQLQWAIYIMGGIGTLLAAIGMEVWIAFTGALVAAFGTYLEYQQIEKTLMKYNRAALELNNVKTWWIALPAAEQEKQINIDNLVMRTEQILSTEFSDWMQEMQNALSSLKEKQQKMLKNPSNLADEKNEDKKADKLEIKQDNLPAKQP